MDKENAVTNEEMVKLTESDIMILVAIIPLQNTVEENEVQERNRRRLIVYQAILARLTFGEGMKTKVHMFCPSCEFMWDEEIAVKPTPPQTDEGGDK